MESCISLPAFKHVLVWAVIFLPFLLQVPPTHAKSPKLTWRKSCSDTPHTPEGGNGSAVCCRLHRHSIGNSKDVSSKAQCSPKSASKTGSATKSRVTKSTEDLKASMKKVGQPSAANFALKPNSWGFHSHAIFHFNLYLTSPKRWPHDPTIVCLLLDYFSIVLVRTWLPETMRCSAL